MKAMRAEPESVPGRSPLRGDEGLFLRSLKSLKLAIGVLAFIALVSSIGTLIPQEKLPEFYSARYGPVWGSLIRAAGFSDLYHSLWFLGLCGWVVASMAICSLSHLKFLNLPGPRLPEKICPERWEIARAAIPGKPIGDIRTVEEGFARLLRDRSYRFSARDDGGGRLITAEKGALGRFGPLTIHWGCIVVLSGGFLSTMLGSSHRLRIAEGETKPVPGIAASVSLDDFSIERYAGTDHDKGYESRITISEGGEKTAGAIRINEPFVHRGRRFYEMDFRAEVKDVRVGVGRRNLALRIGEPVELSEEGSVLEAVEFLPDFVFHEGKASSRSEKFKNPAARLRVSFRDGTTAERWVFPDAAGNSHRARRGFPSAVRLLSFEPRYSVGLKIVRDPARPVVYLGLLIVIAGTFLTTTVFHRRLFVRIVREGGVVQAGITCAARRDRIGVEAELADISAAFGRAR